MKERIAVLRQKIHGMDASEYRDAIEARLPECRVDLATTPAEEREYLESATVATGLEITPAELDAADDLSLFACVYAGTDHLDLDAFEKRGIAVTNASGVHGSNIAEYVTGSMIAMSQRFPRAWNQQENAEWRAYPTRELHGSTVAVVGLGEIGRTIADRLAAFGMETVGVRYSPEKGGPTDEVYGFPEIHEAVADAEYVVLACRLSEATEGLIDAAVLRTMPSDALLVNVARGPVVETDALVESLQSNAIGGAVLDVTDPEPLPPDHVLWSMGDVMITPHNSGHTPEYYERCADILAANVEARAEGGDLENRVV
jgi:phosphoglycerate dehydrogenase-like enzyme